MFSTQTIYKFLLTGVITIKTFQNILSFVTHAICYTSAFIVLVLIGCFIFRFNPTEFYTDATWAVEKSTEDSAANQPALTQAIIDAKISYEKKLEEQAAAQQAAALAQAEAQAALARQTARTVGNSYGTLYIDRLGMEQPIYYGDDPSTLRKGPGQYAGSALPGEGSQILIAGHNTSHFKPLQNIQIGDIIRFVTGYGEFNYKVVSTRVASMNDTTTYNFSLDYEQLALYTCYPFSGPPGKTERFFVYADLITDNN